LSIENIILLPTVSRAIAESEGYERADLESRLNALKAAIFSTLNSSKAIDAFVTRYCRRRIDRILKKIDLRACQKTNESSLGLAAEGRGFRLGGNARIVAR
jgi:hypothetical protein